MPSDEVTKSKFAKDILTDVRIPAFGVIADSSLPLQCSSAQAALEAAKKSSINALQTAQVMNRLDKMARGVAPQGQYSDSSQDAMRSALLFAGAGLDQSLKRLVAGAGDTLIEKDSQAREKFEQWAESAITHPGSGGVDPKYLVDLLLGAGDNPKSILILRYIHTLQANSVQSAEKVTEVTRALGTSDPVLRKRVAATRNKTNVLERAFVARNEISHELDLARNTGTRAHIRRARTNRTYASMNSLVGECIEVTQLVINDVGARIIAK